jgi:hypothetical protein
MDIEMINKFLKVVIAAVVLSASGYASKASALSIESELSLTTYDWSATCYDCKDGNEINKRPEDPTLWKGVTGSITLSDYTLGDAITSTNFVSFAYTGESQFLPMFTVGAGEGFDFTTVQVAGTLFANAELTLDLLGSNTSAAPREPVLRLIPTLEDMVQGYDSDYQGTWERAQQDCEDLYAGSNGEGPNSNMAECIGAADDVRHYIESAIRDANDEINYLTQMNDHDENQYERAQASYVSEIQLSISPKLWSFGRYEGNLLDIGSGFEVLGLPPVMPANKVPAPATLAIFALGLMGLGLRRFKKQS